VGQEVTIYFSPGPRPGQVILRADGKFQYVGFSGKPEIRETLEKFRRALPATDDIYRDFASAIARWQESLADSGHQRNV